MAGYVKHGNIHGQSRRNFWCVLGHLPEGREPNCLPDTEPISVPASTLSQPIPLDVNGDMKIDLLGVPTVKRGSSTPLQVWENHWNASNTQTPLFEL